jgi:Type VI secretion system (T6SS), amidase effector protein 4
LHIVYHINLPTTMALINGYAQMKAAYPQFQHWNEVIELIFRSPDPAKLNLRASSFMLTEMERLMPQGKLINTCCIRMSHVLNHVSANKISKSATDKIRYFPGCVDRNTLEKGNYIFSVREISAYMRAKYGNPLSMKFYKPNVNTVDTLMWKEEHGPELRQLFMDTIANKSGIMVIIRPGVNVGGTGTFSGHVDLWDFGQCYHDDSITDSARQLEFWAVD